MKVKGRILIFMLCLTALFMFAACGQGGSGLQGANDGSTVSTLAKNNRPVADAGLDQLVYAGTGVRVNGSDSYDPEGTPLTYLWEFVSVPAGSAASFLSPTSATTWFTADMEGTYEISLTVDDGKKPGDPDTVLITAITNIPAPPANLIADTLPDTGQITRLGGFYNATGIDADYSINPPAFQNNLDGTVTDLVTGLMWQQDVTSAYGSGASTVCDSLSLAGHDDWRLPSKKELMSIYSFSETDQKSVINIDFFNIDIYSTGPYWSSTVDISSPQGTTYYWALTQLGDLYGTNAGSSADARCVRGDGYQTEKAFTDNGDGTVTDSATGLQWQQGDSGLFESEVNISYCENLSLAGHDDWRLPNIKELESLTVDTLNSPVGDLSAFPGMSNDPYLTSTVWTIIPNRLFSIDFTQGASIASTTRDQTRARCVR